MHAFRRAAQLEILALCCVTILLIILQADLLPRFRVELCYASILIGVVTLCEAGTMAYSASGEFRILPSALGVIWIGLGAGVETIAVLATRPDLKYVNHIITILQCTGHSNSFVFAYVAMGEVLMVGTLSLLWIAWTRSCETIVDELPPTRNYWLLLKASTGGRDLTFRQWLVPLTYSELPAAVPLVWATLVVAMGAWVMRYLSTLVLFNVVPWWFSWVIASLGGFVSWASYVFWLRANVRLDPQTSSNEQSESRDMSSNTPPNSSN
jgi:hypothetical protein